MTYDRDGVTFVETKLFTKLAQEHLSDDEYAALQQSLVVHPEAGDLFRARAAFVSFAGVLGAAKRGGLRVLYFCDCDTARSGC